MCGVNPLFVIVRVFSEPPSVPVQVAPTVRAVNTRTVYAAIIEKRPNFRHLRPPSRVISSRRIFMRALRILHISRRMATLKSNYDFRKGFLTEISRPMSDERLVAI